MIKTELWLAHLADEAERVFMRRILDKINLTLDKGVWTHTPFLNPEQIKNLDGVLTAYKDELVCRRHQLFSDGEYAMLSFSEGHEEDMETCPFSILKLSYPKQFATLTHRDVLGTLMSLGLKRESIGDIRILPGACYAAVTHEMGRYVESNLTTIKQVGITVTEVGLEEVPHIDAEFQLLTFTVASMRLDVLVAAITKMSREKAKSYISSQKVKVNYAISEDQALQLKEGDLLSIRGFGRFTLSEVLGETKKNRLRVQIKKTKS